MELVHDRPAHPHFIRSCEAGVVRIGEQSYRHSLIVTSYEIISDWPPTGIGDLELAHFEVVLARRPEIVLLGTGAVSRMPSPKYLAWFNSRGIGFEAMNTPAACRTFNIVLEEGREVVAALML